MTAEKSTEIKSKIIDLLKRKDDFLLLGHHSADGDSLGSIIALSHFLKKQLGKRVYMPYPEKFPIRYSFLENSRTLFEPYTKGRDYTTIVLDCSSSNRLHADEAIDKVNIDIVIDHHEGTPDFRGIQWSRPDYPAVGIMIYEILKDMDADFTPEISEALYTAILTDTGQFAFAGTTSESLKIAGFLIDHGAQPAKIARHLYWEFPHEYILNMKAALNRLELLFDKKVSFVYLLKKDMQTEKQINETEAIIDLGIMIKGVEITALFREIDENMTRISFRSRDGINVSKLAKKFGGGGRFNASGCNIHENIEKSKKMIIDEISEMAEI
ncbi:MAG: DHH family phosphoesterase [Candidatus Zixiibacteriota bacterium]